MPTHYRGSPETVRALNTYIKFSRASSSLESRLFQGEMFEDLTPSQFGVLETLYHLGPLCQGDLSGKLLKSTGNMTLVLDNLEKRSLVQRRRESEDRRMVTISLTQEGQNLIQRVFPQVAEMITREFGTLTPQEQDTFAALCLKLGRQMK